MKISIIQLIFILFPLLSTAQQKIELSDIERQIYVKINQIRVNKRLDTLAIDSALTKASDQHAKYLSKKGRLTHFQRDKKFKTPNDRALFFGSNHNQIGENVAYTSNYSPSSSPEEIAVLIVKLWMKSRDHKKTILTGLYNKTGISVKYKNGMYFAVQVFAN